MPFEGMELRHLTETDIAGLVASGLAEHLHLEYKESAYSENHDGRKEFLLDICQFANAQGGLLLVGIPELRDEEGRQTGQPDPNVPIGIQCQNREQLLQAWDARVVDSIEERLRVESFPIPIANGARHVLAFRIPDSVSKPHCVAYAGHTYFPSRRERHRYYMDVREIKELSVRVASQLERAEIALRDALPVATGQPTLAAAIMPLFHREFLVDIRQPRIVEALARFEIRGQARLQPVYGFEGLTRQSQHGTIVTLMRTGLIRLTTTINGTRSAEGNWQFYPNAFDVLLRNFLLSAREVISAAELPSPFLLKVVVHSGYRLDALDGFGTPDATVPAGSFGFPSLQIANISDRYETFIQPFCDQFYQIFGYQGSRSFNPEGVWIARAY